MVNQGSKVQTLDGFSCKALLFLTGNTVYNVGVIQGSNGTIAVAVGHTSGGWRGFTVYCTFFHILGACQFFTRINNASAGCRRKHCNAMPCHGPAARGQLLPALASQQGSMAWHGMDHCRRHHHSPAIIMVATARQAPFVAGCHHYHHHHHHETSHTKPGRQRAGGRYS